MAKADLEVPFAAINGRLGSANDTYFCTRFGKTVVSHYPRHKNPKKITSHQRDLSSNFANAVRLAENELADTQRKDQWLKRFEEQKQTAKKPYVILRNFVIAEIIRQNTQN
jgi:hypothetical protein